MTDIFFPDGASSPLLLERTQKSPWSTLRVLSSRPALLQEEKKKSKQLHRRRCSPQNFPSFTNEQISPSYFVCVVSRKLDLRWWENRTDAPSAAGSSSHHQPVCPLLAPHLIHQLRSIRRLCSEGNQRRHHATLTPAVLTLLAVCMSSHPVEGKINWRK